MTRSSRTKSTIISPGITNEAPLLAASTPNLVKEKTQSGNNQPVIENTEIDTKKLLPDVATQNKQDPEKKITSLTTENKEAPKGMFC